MLARWSMLDDDASHKAFGGGLHPVLQDEVEAFTPEVVWWVRLWNHYKAGHLWRAGGIEDQPNRYLEAIEILGAEFARVQNKEAARAQRKAQAGYGSSGKAHLKIHR